MASEPSGLGTLYVGDTAPSQHGDVLVDTTSSTTDVDLVVITDAAGTQGRVSNGAVAAAAAIVTHEAAGDPHPGYQLESGKDQASGYAGLNAASRTAKGLIAADDLVITDATKGLVLKDTAAPAHYWRLSVSTTGVLSTADLGTSPP